MKALTKEKPIKETVEKQLIFDSLPIMHHHKPRERAKWRNNKPTVVPGLTMSIQAMMARAQIGLPPSVPTRMIETYFRETDLTDISQINNAYTKLAADVQAKHQSFTRAKEEAMKQRHLDFAQMKEFINKSKTADKTEIPAL